MNISDLYCKFMSTDVNCYYCDTLMFKKETGKNLYCFTCYSCKEKFYYGSSASSFSFTCNEMLASINFKNNTVSISTYEMITDYDSARKFMNNTVPLFQVDFSNKEKLTNKLKTYLSFS